MNTKDFIIRLIPRPIRKALFRQYATNLYYDACRAADELYEKTGHRHFVLGTRSGNLKVTDCDNETRDRKRDHRLLKRSIRKPYQLRSESFYFTKSDVCKQKYRPQGLSAFPAEWDAYRERFLRWYFKYH